MTTVKVQDGLKIGLCLRGQRQFCRAHGIDFRELADHGIPVERLTGIEDAQMARMIAEAEQRERRQ